MKSLKCISVFPLILAVLIIWPQVSIAKEVNNDAAQQDTVRQRSVQEVRHEAQKQDVKRQRSAQDVRHEAQKQDVKRQRSAQEAHHEAQMQDVKRQRSADEAHHDAQATEAAAIGEELKEIQIQYHETRAIKAKERLHVRSQELVTQLFEAKVRRKVQRIKAIEARLAEEKKSLSELHSRKQKMIQNGTEQALQTGEMPEWGP